MLVSSFVAHKKPSKTLITKNSNKILTRIASPLTLALLCFFQLFLSAMQLNYASAQTANVIIPNFWDVNARTDKPDLREVRIVRILTDDDYPPLTMQNFDGSPTGFSVELAREACFLLGIKCEVQVNPFGKLLEALNQKKGDVVISAMVVNPYFHNKYSLTSPYFRNPGRFVTNKDGTALNESLAVNLKEKKIVVVSGSQHEAFLRIFYPLSEILPAPDFATAAQALKNKQVDFLFADGVNASIWLNGANSEECCVMTGLSYLENRYFGEGFRFILRSEDEKLKRAFDYAFQQMYHNGIYQELYLRFFPINPY